MRFLSVCSGIEAASVAWDGIHEAVAFSEIEPFPSAVLKYHYPNVPNLGDMTKFKEWPKYEIDMLVGGTPCQSFSVAGLRKGLDDPRGNLMLVFLGIADRFKPRWIVWENVPGVLSSGKGRDFGTFLGALAELGYGWAYRILDAQYFGVAQRRRRVFVVGYFGDWRRAAAVLFEPESLCRDIAKGRKTGEEVAGTIKGGSGSRGYPDPSDGNGGMLTLSKCLLGKGGSGRMNPETETMIQSENCPSMGTNQNATGRNTPKVQQGMSVRRLTPRECERLQGFPDDYTMIPWRGKMAPDGPRYKALGNSMTVPVMRWIGERIQIVSEEHTE